jgi:hypothetical protein
MFGIFDLIGFELVNVDTGETESALLLTLAIRTIGRLCYAFIPNASLEKCLDLCAVIAEGSWNSQCRPLQTRDRAW